MPEEDRREIIAGVEAFFDRVGRARLLEIGDELRDLGFEERSADSAVVEFVNFAAQLFLIVTIDEDGCIHGYEIIPGEDMGMHHEKFRW